MIADLISNYPILLPCAAAIVAVFLAIFLLETLPLHGGKSNDEAVFPRN